MYEGRRCSMPIPHNVFSKFWFKQWSPFSPVSRPTLTHTQHPIFHERKRNVDDGGKESTAKSRKIGKQGRKRKPTEQDEHKYLLAGRKRTTHAEKKSSRISNNSETRPNTPYADEESFAKTGNGVVQPIDDPSKKKGVQSNSTPQSTSPASSQPHPASLPPINSRSIDWEGSTPRKEWECSHDFDAKPRINERLGSWLLLLQAFYW